MGLDSGSFSHWQGVPAYGTIGTATAMRFAVPFFVSRREEKFMGDDDVKSTSNDDARDDDAQVDDIVSDDDADTRDIEENDDENTDEIQARFTALEETLDRILGELSSIREAQGILVENGAVITENDANIDYTDDDSFVPPAELDLLI